VGVTAPVGFLKMLAKGRTAGVLIFPFIFPEVFYPASDIDNPSGFNAILGNPPWDKILPFAKEFFASFNFDVIAAPTKRERTAIEKRLLSDVKVKRLYEDYIGEFRAIERSVGALYRYQVVDVDGESTIGKQDAYRLFVERANYFLVNGGFLGFVLPSAFHSSEGATGVRRLCFSSLSFRKCFSFENRKKIFDIHRSFKFAVITAQKQITGTTEFLAAFYLQDDSWLFSDNQTPAPMVYTKAFVEQTGASYLNFLELRSAVDMEVIKTYYKNGQRFGEYCDKSGIRFGRELNMTDDAWRFTPTEKVLLESDKDPRDPDVAKELLSLGYFTLQEGRTYHQFTHDWEGRPRYLISFEKVLDKPSWQENTRYYRPAYRGVTNATNERAAIFHIFTPANLFGNNSPADLSPSIHPLNISLSLVGAVNTFAFDYAVRQKISSYLNYFLLSALPLPRFDRINLFLCHSTVRLVCNHSGYSRLWQEQLGDEWRESVPVGTYPVLAGEDARWEVRSAIDAVVAQAYRLSCEQYAHVLSTFSHKSYPKAPSLCLAKFDELLSIGLEAFVRRYDPYWDVPLVESLPSPVIELPKLGVSEGAGFYDAKDMFGNPLSTDLFGNVVGKKRKGRK
jgi:hypothetical protein